MTDAPPAWREWVGREARAADRIDAVRVAALQATLDDPGAALGDGDPLPPLWHWLYFWELTVARGLGPEGHTALGEFLPPVELPRRMWAGSRISFRRPLLIGAQATRCTEIRSISEKLGRSGRLVFVTLDHVISDGDGPAIHEQQDIVYRAPAAPGETPRSGRPAPSEPAWQCEVMPDPVLLFRYSALTFNAHRIHYDADYARDVEGYPGLIVHGPLMATLMVEQLRRRRPAARVEGFCFRALSPIFAGTAFTVAGEPDDRGADVWIVNPEGVLAMDGRVDVT